MIKNIVFDMGNVLVRYDSMKVCEQYIDNEEERKQVNTSVFVSPEWVLLDMGVISEAEALQRMQNRLPKEHARKMAKLCLEHWHEYCMWEMPGMRGLVEELKSQGLGIYLCSNASLRLLSCYKKVIPAVDRFDGVLFSAEVKCIKPQKEIYLHLYERFGIKAEESFFIDDIMANILGAEKTGMKGYCFEDGDVERLRKRLCQEL